MLENTDAWMIDYVCRTPQVGGTGVYLARTDSYKKYAMYHKLQQITLK